MRADQFRNHRLEYNDTVTYWQAEAGIQNPDAPAQPKADRPYVGRIADFTDTRIGVRADGLHGKEPLYYVQQQDIISVRSQQERTR